jgi:hypothetical protein
MQKQSINVRKMYKRRSARSFEWFEEQYESDCTKSVFGGSSSIYIVLTQRAHQKADAADQFSIHRFLSINVLIVEAGAGEWVLSPGERVLSHTFGERVELWILAHKIKVLTF